MTDTPTFMGLTRTYYYDGQLLNQNSFVNEQQYVRDLTYNQNLALVTSGVIDGLDVTIVDEALQVAPGAAMCDAGIMIFVTEDKSFTDFSSLTSSTTYRLLLTYSDNTNGDPSQLQQSQIITESFTLSPVETSGEINSKSVILGTFTYTTSGPTALDTSAASGRVQAAMKLDPKSGTPQVASPKAAALAAGSPDVESPAPASPAVAAPTAGSAAVRSAPVAKPTTASAAVASPANGFKNPYVQPLTVGGVNVLGGWLNIDAELTASGQSSALVIGVNDGIADIKFGNTEPKAALSIMTASVDDKDTLYIDATGQVFSQGDAAVLTAPSNISNAIETLSNAQTVLTTPAVTGTPRYAIMGTSLSGTAAVTQSSGGQSLVSYDALVVLLVAAVNELNDRVEALESEG